jgi:hypothetical protein
VARVLTAGPPAFDGRVYQWDGRSFQAAAARHPRLAQSTLTTVPRYVNDYSDRHLFKTRQRILLRHPEALLHE